MALAITAVLAACRVGYDPLSASGDAGQLDAGRFDAANPPGHVIFASSEIRSGVLAGLGEADALCDDAASAAGLPPGTYRALLSTTSASAFDRLAIGGEIRNTRGELVAADAASFWSVNHLVAVGYDENGDPVTGEVWTGSDRTGSISTRNCVDWTSAVDRGMTGDPAGANSSWVELAPRDCNTARAFYCVSN